MNDFLPTGYEAPVIEGDYLKLKKGENRFRVLSSAITGFEYWNTSNKPVRSKEMWEEAPSDIKPDQNKIRHFWAFVVWNYGANKVQIMEITQKGIQESIRAYVANPKWGSPKGYDLVINASGDGLEREYTTIAEPHSPAPEANISNIKLDALFKGEDPFSSTKQ